MRCALEYLMMKPNLFAKIAGAAAGATAWASAATAQDLDPGSDARWTVTAGPTLGIIDANNMGNSDDPSCAKPGEGECRTPGGALVGGNNLEGGLQLELARRDGQVELAGSVYRGCSDFHFLQSNPGEGKNCATEAMGHARYYTHGPDARWSGFVGGLAGVSHQTTDFVGVVQHRPDWPLQFGGSTTAPVYGAEFGVEGRFDARWAVRVGCGWRQTGDNRLPVYVNGVRDVRDNPGPEGANGDQSWHRTNMGCGLNLRRTLGDR